jgi:hypothetical protein
MSRARIVAIIVVGALLAALVAAGAGWRYFTEERRLARTVAGVVSARIGLPISIERASIEGSRLKLWGVRLAPVPGWALDTRMREVEVVGGLLPLMAPAGHRVSVIATATSVALSASPATVPPDAAALDHVRAGLRGLLDWPGGISLRMEGAELHAGSRVFRFDLVGDKTAAALTLDLSLRPAPDTAALTLRSRAGIVGEAGISVDLDVGAEPRRLAGLWPEAWPTPGALTMRLASQWPAKNGPTATGRLTVGEPSQPAVAEFTAGIESARGELLVPSYTIDWGPEFHLDGEAAMTSRGGLRVTATGVGTIDASPLRGRATWAPVAGDVDGELSLQAVNLNVAARRLGLKALPDASRARSLTVRISGRLAGNDARAALTMHAQGLSTAALPRVALDAGLEARLALGSGPGLAVRRLEAAQLTVSGAGGPMLVATAASRSAPLWPLRLDGALPDAARVPADLPLTPRLTGSARVTGEMSLAESVTFGGTLEISLPRAEVRLGSPVRFTDLQATVPVAWGLAADDRPGSLTVGRVDGFSLALHDAVSSASIADGRLLLPDLRYGHYGGRGGGWAELGLDGRPTRLRARLEGQGLDLAQAIRESGATAARVTGKARYRATAQYTDADGLVALVRLDSEADGGEVSIDAIEGLLDSAAVQAETSGVLRQTLQNLRVFRYETLEGEMRVSGGGGWIDLSLRGKKRLGLFPAPVEAINFRNVPLAVLSRTLTRGTPP